MSRSIRRCLPVLLISQATLWLGWPAPANAQSAPLPGNPQDWFSHMLSQALLTMHLKIVDGLLGAVTAVDFFYRTDLDQTVNHPAVQRLHTTTLALAGSLLAALLLGGTYSIMLRHVGLGGLTPQQLIARLIVAAAAIVTSREWIGWTIELNNALCRLVGHDRLVGNTSGIEALALLLGLSSQQTATLNDALSRAGAAVSQAFLTTLFGPAPATVLTVLLLLMLAILLVLLAVQFLLRLVFLNLLIILAPLMLVLGVLPATASWAQLWVRWFFPTVFLQAFQVAILALSHDWLRRSYEGGAGLSQALVSLLMTMSGLYLTLKAPALLEVGYRSALTVASSFRTPVAGSLGNVAAGRRLIDRLRPR